jgi:hypothetical protein
MSRIIRDKSLIKSVDLLTLLRITLQDKAVILDCGHRFCMHHFSNTIIITPEGKTFCHNCYN